MHGVSFAARQLLERVRQLLPTTYQQDSLDALMGLFLQATGAPLPQHSRLKSPSALSRFLNHYPWPVRAVIRAARRAVLEQIQRSQGRGRRPGLAKSSSTSPPWRRQGSSKGSTSLSRS
jgi:hypothetical protein